MKQTSWSSSHCGNEGVKGQTLEEVMGKVNQPDLGGEAPPVQQVVPNSSTREFDRYKELASTYNHGYVTDANGRLRGEVINR